MDDAPQEDSTVPPYIWEDGQSMNEDEMKLLQDVADQLEQHATGE
jgi:cytochrome c556